MARIHALPANGDISSSFLVIVDSRPEEEAENNSSSDELSPPNIQFMILDLPVTTVEVDQVLSEILRTNEVVVSGVEFGTHK